MSDDSYKWNYMVAYLSGDLRDAVSVSALAMAEAMSLGELGEVHIHNVKVKND